MTVKTGKVTLTTTADWQAILSISSGPKDRVVFVCSDNGLSSTDGTTWVTYKKDDNSENGKAIITNGTEKKEIPLSPSISHNFIIGVDADDDVLWVATSKGVSRGELLK